MKVCLVSNEILGARRSGGIGTVTSHLALLLAKNGHSVTLYYAGPEPLDPADAWVAYYKFAGVDVCLDPDPPALVYPKWMRQPVGIFERLQYWDFDVILFQEWLGLGHACMVAKRTGLAFHNTTLAVITHSSTGWIFEGNRTFPANRSHLALMHMERQSAELADAVVSPSRYMVRWMQDAGWKLPEDTAVLRTFFGGSELLGVAHPSPVTQPLSRQGVPRLAFFGRLEERKGIGVFLASLVSPELKPFHFNVAFIGLPATKSPKEIRAFIGEHRPDLLSSLEFHPNLSSDEAQALLASTNSIAIMPSLVDNSPGVVYEALRRRLPFVASSVGGIPELIQPSDWDRCLFEPEPGALAAKLREVLTAASWEPPRASFDERENASQWLAWFAEHAPMATQRVKSPPLRHAPDTTVILTHFERPSLAEQALRALAVQSDNNFNVVLVDDGSQSSAAVEFLEQASRGIGGLKIQVVRQPNKYLGAARNAGLRHAQGSYVIFLDDDNVPFPNMVEVLRKAALHSQADIVTCQMQLFPDPTGQPDIRALPASSRWAFPGGPLELGVIQNCFGDATAIYKRDTFDRIGGFHEIRNVTYEDWQLHLRASLEGLTLLSLPLPLFWYRVTPDSMSRTTNYGANMRMIASAVQEKIPRSLAKIVDLMIGSHPPEEG